MSIREVLFHPYFSKTSNKRRFSLSKSALEKMIKRVRNLAEITELSLFLKKLMIDFYYDQIEFEIESIFFE